jgi:hypothetical protein
MTNTGLHISVSDLAGPIHNALCVLTEVTSGWSCERQISTGEALIECIPGRYCIAVLATGYRTVEQVCEVGAGLVTPVSITMETA